MVMLLMIADDFTGALDAGVKFTECGAQVRVVADYEYDFGLAGQGVQVLVLNAETRHISPKEAYDRVYEVVKRAGRAGIPYIYKKTDSALRGNIGSELAGMLDACGRTVLHFIPAFPKMGRTTEQGIQYIDGIPVSESVFGKDPFEPVTSSDIAELIHQQSNTKVKAVSDGTIVMETNEPAIAVYDAKTDEELMKLAKKLAKLGQLQAIAGCAGLAEMLPLLLKLEGPMPKLPLLSQNFLVVCGSVNPITQRQTAFAEQHGFERFRLTPVEKLEAGYYETEAGYAKVTELAETIKKTPFCILDTNDETGRDETLLYAKAHGISREEMRRRISDTLGYLMKELIRNKVRHTVLITGGDTLMGFMNRIGVYEMVPLEEIITGIVLSRFAIEGKEYEVISKSGGFGEEDLIVDLAEIITKEEKERDIG